MTRISADYREFVRVSVDLPANPKLALIDNPAAGWAYVVSLCYCGQHLTDGTFPMGPLLRLAGVKPAVGKKLIQAGLWHESGHACERCPQPMAGTGVVHDYLIHQRSSGEAKALRNTRREAGLRGAASRWGGNGDGNSHGTSHSNSHDDAMASGELDLGLTPGKAMPEEEGEEEKEQKKTPSSSSEAAQPPRDDVAQLCARLADRIEANTEKPVNVTQRWRDSARLLLDKDLAHEAGALDLALRLADWATNDEFWRTNILSMPTFREKFTQLRLKARREWQQSQRSPRDMPDNVTGWQALKATGTDDRPHLRAITGGDQP